MKYIKLMFSIVIIISFFTITAPIYGINKTEDLTLSRIYVEPGTLEPEFSETRDYYTLLLEPTVSDLIIQATPTNEELHYEIKGNENLKEGENIITITVFSSDNSKSKVYTINALKTAEPDKYNALLNTLIIDNYPFNEDFFPETFNYTVKDNVIDKNSLEIFAYPQNPNAKVEINRNNNGEGEDNTISITVTSENGLAKRIYTINLHKDEVVNQPTLSTNNALNEESNSEFKVFLTTSLIIIILLIIIIYLVKKRQ